jgi:hypothetical protein
MVVTVVAENEGWSVFVPGAPVAADGVTFAEAWDEFVVALREYAQDWTTHLHAAPNHRRHADLLRLAMSLS